jgi:hypothetical protein
MRHQLDYLPFKRPEWSHWLRIPCFSNAPPQRNHVTHHEMWSPLEANFSFNLRLPKHPSGSSTSAANITTPFSMAFFLLWQTVWIYHIPGIYVWSNKVWVVVQWVHTNKKVQSFTHKISQWCSSINRPNISFWSTPSLTYWEFLEVEDSRKLEDDQPLASEHHKEVYVWIGFSRCWFLPAFAFGIV